MFGAVLAWGQVEAHRHGLRAECAEIVVLAYHPEQPYEHAVALQALAGEFGVPLVTLTDLLERSREFGEPFPPELRPGNKNAPTNPLTAQTPPELQGAYETCERCFRDGHWVAFWYVCCWFALVATQSGRSLYYSLGAVSVLAFVLLFHSIRRCDRAIKAAKQLVAATGETSQRAATPPGGGGAARPLALLEVR